ncbi:MAG: hypothetical protein PVJ84_14485 [Desulfobacteraceae bacterium]|jgi:hypothetical protein
MKIYNRNNPIKRRFDFEIGYLKKSPCRTCSQRPLFPDCINACELLDRIQTKLARGISTTHSHSALEPFALYLDQQQDK